ncbi:MAG TPA: NCS2 family permease [Bryobacteraceae bacterium]|nr:NCS2 family permease [Bryobacteraceae bacterium]
MKQRLERYFEFERLQTNWRTEIVAGATTFVTMAYIIFVNPSILRETGMPFGALVAATCLCAAFGSVLMGAYARYPIALAPGMGLNAYFTYTVVKGLGVPWQVALGAVFISGVIFLLLTFAGVRQLIVSAIPKELYAAVASGIGLFIALIGLRNAGIVVPSPATMVTLGNLRDPQTLLALFGLLVTAALLAREVRAAMLIGVLATTALGAGLGLVQWEPGSFALAELGATAFQLDIWGAWQLGAVDIIFVFLFVDLFDNIGTLVAVGTKAGIFDETNRIPRLDRILFTDASATVAGSVAGTSTVVSYIESAAGVVAGGRSGVTAIVTGLLFLLALFVAPLAGAIPAAATAPALILVGSMVATHMAEIDWADKVVAIPAFLTIVAIPLTFSIANGIAFGFTMFTFLCVMAGRRDRVNWLMYGLSALFLLRFLYLGAA